MIINYDHTMLSTSELWQKYGDNELRNGLIKKLEAFLIPTDGSTINEEGIFYIGNDTTLILSQVSASHLYSYLAK